MPLVFCADPDEFDRGSEQALTLVEMRGKAFYDVMPLAELCKYQLKVLKKYLAENCPELSAAMTLTIDDSIELVNKDATCCKVPGEQFGRITVSIDPLAADQYPQMIRELSLLTKEADGKEQIYLIDESPLVLLEKVKEVTNSLHSNLDLSL